MITNRPPRLKDFDYLGLYRYFLTICTEDRQAPFCDIALGRRLVDHFLQYAEGFSFAVTAYCLMPDHLHALIEGTTRDANLKKFVRQWKQKTSYEWKQRTGTPLWQQGYYDRVLREEDGDLWVISYLADNPLKAGLAESPDQYPLFGSSRYSIEEIMQALQELKPWKPY
jgi:putative transposase